MCSAGICTYVCIILCLFIYNTHVRIRICMLSISTVTAMYVCTCCSNVNYIVYTYTVCPLALLYGAVDVCGVPPA